MQKEGRFYKQFALFLVLYAALVSLFYWIVKEDWSKAVIVTEALNADTVLPELTGDDEIRQDFVVAADRLQKLTLQADKLTGAADDGILKITIYSQAEDVFTAEVPYSVIDENGKLSVETDLPEEIRKGDSLTMALRADGKLAFRCGTTRSAGRFEVSVETSGLQMNGTPVEGELVLTQQGVLDLNYMHYFWPVAGAAFVLLSGMIWYCHVCRVKGRKNSINLGVLLIDRYRYLLKTLVVRDFKIKYRASMLGVLWSFLNPLLMTFVYMFVFSTLFRNSIENFVVYLMSGIILFNYFSEATNLGMQSIVGNAGLITKVYMPKYIFPISKVLSSGINMMISLIPLLIMMAITGVRFSKSLLLIPLALVFLVLFCVGVALTLSAAMVYFRDIQFLWGIMLTILNFLSPVFYPESIIPARFLTLYHMNPLYQYMFFMRTITLGGVSPTPVTYLYCFLASLLSLTVGLFVFRKAQSSFVLHL